MTPREQFERPPERATGAATREHESGVPETRPRAAGVPPAANDPATDGDAANVSTDRPRPDGSDPAVTLDDRSLAASDLTVRRSDGGLAALTVRPVVDCTWTRFDDPPAEAGATLLVRADGETGFDPVATELLPVHEAPAGERRLAFASSHDVLATTSLDAVDFEPPWQSDRPRTRTLTLRLVVDLLDEDGIPVSGDVATADREVTVEADCGAFDG